VSPRNDSAPPVDLSETGIYAFRRQLDAACVARIEARFNRPLTPADVDQLLERAS
jgi:hypothetical protein